ncbi:MAG: AraC family transcriptional regulator, partial [Aestuariibacter sp.]|nr:AraC family transcriptional regulator [Aestuariibacter sp.]
MSLFSVSEQALRVCLLVLPETSMMTLASTLDPMRAANRIASRGLFEWQLLTIDNQPATLTCGIPVAPQGQIDIQTDGDLLFVIAGFNQYKYVNRQQLKIIKQLSSRFRAVGGIEAGSWVLARCGLLDGKQATTHWEDHEEFTMQFPRVALKADRFIIDDRIFTTGGASPTFDFMLY